MHSLCWPTREELKSTKKELSTKRERSRREKCNLNTKLERALVIQTQNNTRVLRATAASSWIHLKEAEIDRELEARVKIDSSQCKMVEDPDKIQAKLTKQNLDLVHKKTEDHQMARNNRHLIQIVQDMVGK